MYLKYYIVWWWNTCPSAMYVEAGICQIQSQCKHICMFVCNYECMYVYTYTIFICIEAKGFVIDFLSGSMFCILHTRLFRPRRSHKPCFYIDKIQHIIYMHKCIYMFMYVYVHYSIREAMYKEYTHFSAILVTNVSSQHTLAICQLWIEQSQSTVLW